MSSKRLLVKSKKKKEVFKRKIFAFLSWGAVTLNGQVRSLFIDNPEAKEEGKI